ncbi:MAG: PAS domain S-box protein [Candidatus Sulfotelmatobacter sp.]
MDLHPGQDRRHVLEAKRTEFDPIRDLQQADWSEELVQHSRDLLCIHDLHGRLLSVNPAAARTLGYGVGELLQTPMRELVLPEFRPQFEAYLAEVASAGEARGLLALRTRTGERRIWSYCNILHSNGDGSPTVRGIAHDVTDQMRTEKLLRQTGESLLSEVRERDLTIRKLKLFRTLLDQSNDAVEVVDPETLRILDVNEKACAELGYSREELLSMSVFDIDPAINEGTVAKIKEELWRSGSRVVETIHRRKDGLTFPVELSLRRVQLEQDYVVAIARNLTERKLAEARLQDSQDSYRTVHDRAPVGICWIETRTGRLLRVNQKYCDIVGRTEQDLLSRNFQSITHPDDLAGNLEKLRQLTEGEVRHYKMEKRYLRPDGSVRWAEVEVVAMWPEGVDPCWHMAIVQDITERKEAEKKLREYERVVEGLEEMIVVVDREYRYVIGNRAFLNYRNMKKEEVVGRRVDEVVDPEVFDALVKEKMDECFQGKLVEYTMKYTFPRIGERDLFARYFPIEGSGGGVERIAAILEDVTDNKRAEEALSRSEENYRMFISQSSEGIFREDMDAPVLINLPEDELVHHILHDSYMAECNDAMARMYGLNSGQEFVGKRLTELLPPDDPRNIELTREYIRSGFRVLDRESHEIDIHGNPKVFLNSMIGIVENGMLVRTWGIQRDVTETTKLEESRRQAEQALHQNVAQLRAVTEELREAKEKLSEEKIYLEQTIDTELGFGEIIGRSAALKDVVKKVGQVATSDATVLLLGETGTGKELVARALHHLSKRRENSFIKLNCAAIPTGLLESELFGHEKGAFTGAVAKKIGRLELADHGTLFLDEIGEISPELQPKLLRVLQDHEFERLGGTQTIKVNFRLLAATNQDLLQSVKRREFRSDLYYRLNVFPIRIPPLRERREDIPLLVEHFVRKCAVHLNKSITSIPARTMELLMQWTWPGNIRELENFVERSVILTPGYVLRVPLGELNAPLEESKSGTLHERERERIIVALRDCKGQLGGPQGAAARLGLKRTTLQSKLIHFGIDPEGYRV